MEDKKRKFTKTHISNLKKARALYFLNETEEHKEKRCQAMRDAWKRAKKEV